MRFSITDYSISPKGKGWGDGFPTDRTPDMRKVSSGKNHVPVHVHRRVARLISVLFEETEKRGYILKAGQCGGYANRGIKHAGHVDPHHPSNHSWGLAVDLNSLDNPQSSDGKVLGHLPTFVPDLWGHFGFAWGGHYHNKFKDPMHFEFMGDPHDADDMTQKALRLFVTHTGPRATIPPHAVKTYTVQDNDTLGVIAKRFHVPGGWPALFKLNKAIIRDKDHIFPGQVLKLP
jgi:hypothetical protein